MTPRSHLDTWDPVWTVGRDDPFALPARLAPGVDPAAVSRYGDSRWVLNVIGVHGHSAGISVNWDSFPDALRESLRRAGWVIVTCRHPRNCSIARMVAASSGSPPGPSRACSTNSGSSGSGWRRRALPPWTRSTRTSWRTTHGMSGTKTSTTRRVVRRSSRSAGSGERPRTFLRVTGSPCPRGNRRPWRTLSTPRAMATAPSPFIRRLWPHC